VDKLSWEQDGPIMPFSSSVLIIATFLTNLSQLLNARSEYTNSALPFHLFLSPGDLLKIHHRNFSTPILSMLKSSWQWVRTSLPILQGVHAL
jgi:hypothetical protein